MSPSAVVEQLREKIRKLEAQPRQLVLSLRTGIEALDAFGAFRLGTGVELCGEEASGRTTVALSLVAAAGRERRLSAWVDGPKELYPPAAIPLGVELSSLLIARPKEPRQLVWTAMQLLRSGAFTLVVLDVTRTPVRLTMTDAKKLLDAARTGGSLLVLLTPSAAPAQGFVRLMMKTRPPGPRLRLLSAELDAPASLAPTFEIDAPHGKRAEVPARPLPGRRLERPWAPPPRHDVAPRDSLQRPKKNLLRDGYPAWGLYRTANFPPSRAPGRRP